MRSMDLIDRILQALREKAEPIVVQSNFIEILLEFTQYRDQRVNQYVFSMVGDL